MAIYRKSTRRKPASMSTKRWECHLQERSINHADYSQHWVPSQEGWWRCGWDRIHKLNSGMLKNARKHDTKRKKYSDCKKTLQFWQKAGLVWEGMDTLSSMKSEVNNLFFYQKEVKVEIAFWHHQEQPRVALLNWYWKSNSCWDPLQDNRGKNILIPICLRTLYKKILFFLKWKHRMNRLHSYWISIWQLQALLDGQHDFVDIRKTFQSSLSRDSFGQFISFIVETAWQLQGEK